ncbi:S8 family serine peptidase [Paenibacillus chitinolyticus]|uniref:S8 family serine peptidase n=1 Tax=Paenibacillus chitinolyticus TaxID=79263 RepID=UPI001C45CE49|nr:S8 family serine peptidase [Paenibacillus chitinolyticus]MBV6715660.1 S8 family serine peptidase [Paenibacillus chitinolyticus]
MRKISLLVLAALLALSLSVPAFGAEPSLSLKKNGSTPRYERPQALKDALPGQVIVKYKEKADTMSMQGLMGPEKKADLPDPPSSKYKQRVGPKGLVTMEFPKSEPVSDVLEELENDPDVDFVEPVYPVWAAETKAAVRNGRAGQGAGARSTTGAASAADSPAKAASLPNDPYVEQQWWYRAIQSDLADTGKADTKLSGVVIAVVDTGVDSSHDDLKGSLVGGYNFVSNTPDIRDDNGHGTNVAGIAAARKDNGVGIAGVASGAKIMPVKVLDSEGYGRTDVITEGIYWAVDHGADVVNLSLTSASSSRVMEEAVQYALQRGVIVVSAAGNESNHWTGNDTGELDQVKGSEDPLAHRFVKDVAFPAKLPGVLAVGAVDWYPQTEFIVADFSNSGSSLSVVAPGVDIYSTGKGNGYTGRNGTSMAAPMVSGLAALILAGDAGLDDLSTSERVERVGRIISETAKDLGPSGFDDEYGSGLIDVKKAMETPRVSIQAANGSTNLTETGELQADIRLLDKDGSLAENASGAGKADLFAYTSNGTEPQFVKTLTFQANQGKASLTYKPDKAGKYLLVAYNDEKSPLWVSGELMFQKKPQAPQASLRSGSYTGTQKVTLNASDPGAKIYYTLTGAAPTVQSAVYTGPIEISRTQTLRVISAAGGAVSEIQTYRYEIAASGGNTGGGDGTGQPSEETVTPVKADSTVIQEKGYAMLDVKVADENLQPLLKNPDVSLIGVQAVSSGKNNTAGAKVHLPASFFGGGQSKGLLITTSEGTLRLDPGSLQVDSSEEAVISLRRTHATESLTSAYPEGASPMSSILEIKIMAGSRMIGNLQKPATVTLTHAAASDLGVDPEKMGAFVYSEDDSEWKYVKGAQNEGSMTFAVDGSSYAAVFAVDRTFADMSTHWAKRPVEVLAARQIVDGMDASRFVPQAGVTRAQFAAMLARLLQLPAAADGKQQFRDVAKGAWYADVVARSYSAGLVSGVTDDRFMPDEPITREQMAAMLVRAFAYGSGIAPDELPVPKTASFADEGTAGTWAVPYMRKAAGLGLIDGYEDGTFKPLNGATRAESASVIYKLSAREY